MSQRHNHFDQLRTGFDCPESWDGMEGGDSCRFCSNCQRDVYDFAELTPRQIKARLEAGRGRFAPS